MRAEWKVKERDTQEERKTNNWSGRKIIGAHLNNVTHILFAIGEVRAMIGIKGFPITEAFVDHKQSKVYTAMYLIVLPNVHAVPIDTDQPFLASSSSCSHSLWGESSY
jgi:hypothetical protein